MAKLQLTTAAWKELESIVSRFEAALYDQGNAPIREFLAASTIEPLTLLLELIGAEAEYRVGQGDRVSTDEYLQKFADLIVTDSDVARLKEICHEALMGLPAPLQPPNVQRGALPSEDSLTSDPQFTETVLLPKKRTRLPWTQRPTHIGRYEIIAEIPREP